MVFLPIYSYAFVFASNFDIMLNCISCTFKVYNFNCTILRLKFLNDYNCKKYGHASLAYVPIFEEKKNITAVIFSLNFHINTIKSAVHLDVHCSLL